uniref:3CxxC-type domain-containing protein n=1 Tax=Romanomermis culicivorax TaxID=13658 RepID=A0A915HYE5_ROMCU
MNLLTNIDMETLWHMEFDNLFKTFFNVWYLSPLVSDLPPVGLWFETKDSAKVRYLCQKCGQGWTSMKGCVYFWYTLNISQNVGILYFKLMGQTCQKCNDNRFEHPLWYPEEVIKVLRNIYYKVGQTFYGFVRPNFEKQRRPGKPRSQHAKNLCQACQMGFCSNSSSKENVPNSKTDTVQTVLVVRIANRNTES